MQSAPLRSCSPRKRSFVERDAERPPLPIHKDFAHLCSASLPRIAHHDDFSRPHISQKKYPRSAPPSAILAA